MFKSIFDVTLFTVHNFLNRHTSGTFEVQLTPLKNGYQITSRSEVHEHRALKTAAVIIGHVLCTKMLFFKSSSFVHLSMNDIKFI